VSSNRSCIQVAEGLSWGGTWVPTDPGVGFAWLNKFLISPSLEVFKKHVDVALQEVV